MGLCLLLKIWAKTLAVNMIKYLLIMLKYPGEIAFKTSSKRVIQKQRNQLVIWLVITVTNEHDKEIPKERYVSAEKRQEIIDEIGSK